MGRQRATFAAAALFALLALPDAVSAGCGDYLTMPGEHAPKQDSPPCHGWACSGTPLAALAVPLPEAPPRPTSELPLLSGAAADLTRALVGPFASPAEPNLSEPALAGIFRPPRL